VDGLWATKSEGVVLIVRAVKCPRFPTYAILIHQRYRVQTDRLTDGQTCGQTTCNLNTALCTVVHRAVKI